MCPATPAIAASRSRAPRLSPEPGDSASNVPPLFEVQGLSKRFGHITALDLTSASTLNQARSSARIGLNGARAKSTLFA